MVDPQKNYDELKTSQSAGAMSKGKDLTSDDIRSLKDVFQRYPQIQAVYMFGSMEHAFESSRRRWFLLDDRICC